MKPEVKAKLEQMACRIRMDIMEEVYQAKSGHPGGSLSIADVMTYLYFHKMILRPEEPNWEDRDRFVLSKGHCAPALYAALARRGFFPVDELYRFRKIGSILQGHPDRKHIPGVDSSSGSLGQGLSVACGIAKAAKMQGKKYKVYAVVGDGELQEGEIWEAAMFASHHKLDNLCVIVDNNGLQINGKISEVCSPYPIKKKWKSFGFTVYSMDGHRFDKIDCAFEKAEHTMGQPTALIAKTIKGKGVSFMENQASWHGKAPNLDQYMQAIQELKKKMSLIKGGGENAGS